MAITINNGVQNILGTPAAISGVFKDIPAAIDVANGTLYFSTDTLAIYQAISGTWILYTGGGGGGNQNLQQVTDVGNVTTNDIYVNSVYYNDFAAPDQYGRLNINDFGWIFTDIDNVVRCVIQEGAIALKNKISNYQWRLDSENLTKNFVFQLPNSLSGFIQDIIPISVNGVYADINGDIAISTSGSTGINGLNGTTNIGLGGTLLNDVTILGDNFTFFLQNTKSTIFSASGNADSFSIQDNLFEILFTRLGVSTFFHASPNTFKFAEASNYGLQLTFGNAKIYELGQLAQFVINDTNVNAAIKINGDQKLLFFGNYQYIGDLTNVGNLLLLNNDIPNGTNFITTQNGAIENGFKLDFYNSIYQFGDFGGTSYALTINASTAQANLFCSTITLLTGNASGFGASGNQTSIGDVDGNGNSTIFGVDDNSRTLIAENVTIGTIGLLSGDNLKIRINGNDYVIPLYNA